MTRILSEVSPRRFSHSGDYRHLVGTEGPVGHDRLMVVNDWCRVASLNSRLFGRVVNIPIRNRAEFGYPPSNVGAVRVETFGLSSGIEDAVRVRVCTSTRRPLPVQLIRSNVAVDKVLHEMGGAESPVKVKVFGEK